MQNSLAAGWINKKIPTESLVCSNHREPEILHEEQYRTKMGWQKVVLISCLTSSRAPLSSAAASPDTAKLNGRLPISCAAGEEKDSRMKNQCDRQNNGREGWSRQYLGGEEEAAERGPAGDPAAE